MERIEKTLRSLELDRSERIKASHIADAPSGPGRDGGRGAAGQCRGPTGDLEDEGCQVAPELARTALLLTVPGSLAR